VDALERVRQRAFGFGSDSEVLRAVAAAEEPDALAELDPGFTVVWSGIERPSAFHVRLVGSTGGVDALAWVTVDGRPLLASGGVDGVVRLWDVSGQQLVSTLECDGAVTALAANDGQLAIADSSTVRSWPGDRAFVHGGRVAAMAFAGPGRLALARDGDVVLLDLDHMDPL
jgi:WD40 repeat protein